MKGHKLSSLTKKIVKIVMSIMMIITLLPTGHVHAASGTISTDKAEYYVDDAILVTAVSDVAGSWVGIYGAYEPTNGSVTSYYWFYTDGNTHNILTATSNNRVSGNLPAGQYKVVLYDSGYTVLDQANITIKPAPTGEEEVKFISTTKDEYQYGEDIVVNYNYPVDTSSYAWVGIYKEPSGPWDSESLNWEWGCYLPAQFNLAEEFTQTDFSDYESGTYTLYVFSESSTSSHFASTTFTVAAGEVGRVVTEPTCETDGKIVVSYEDGSSKTITAEQDPSLTKLGHAYGDWSYDGAEKKTHSKTCSNPIGKCEKHTITEDCIWNDGEETLAPAPGRNGIMTYTCDVCEGTYTQEISAATETHREVILKPTCDNEGTVRVYYSNGSYIDEPLTKLGHSYGEWTYNGENLKTHTRVCANDPLHTETLNCTFNGGTDVANGKLFTCNDCGGTYVRAYISTDKLTYAYGEPIMVTTNYDGAGAWVGLYKKGETYNPDTGGVKSIFWNYLKDVSNPFNILTSRDENSRGHEYKGGEFTVVLFEGDNYTYFASVDITITKEVVDTVTVDPTCEKDGSITTVYNDGSTDVETLEKLGHAYGEWSYDGAEKKTHSKTCSNPIGKCEKHTITEDCIWNDGEETLAPTPGQNGIMTYTCDVCEGTYTQEISAATETHREVILKPTCDNEGTVRVYYSNGSYIDEPLTKLGHSYGEWTYNGENLKTHTRVCANDPLHTETLNCTFNGGTDVANGKLFTCNDCGGTYVRPFISTDKSTYAYGEDVIVNYYYPVDTSSWAWVGLYKEPSGPWDSVSLYWEWSCYLPEQFKLTEKLQPQVPEEYKSGTYTLYIFAGEATTSYFASTTFTVVAEETGRVVTEPTCEKDGQIVISYEDGTTKTITAEQDPSLAKLGHAYGEWSYDGVEHKTHTKTCSNPIGKCEKHTITEDCIWNDGEETLAPTPGQNGIMTYTCDTCKGTYTQEISAATETHREVILKPTCDNEGTVRVYYSNGSYIDEPLTKLGHSYGEWTYNGENLKTHTRVCANDPTHKETHNCNFNSGTLANGVRTYTCGTCQGTYSITVLSTDKTTYAYGEPIMVTTNYNGAGAWVGLYKKGETYNPEAGGVRSIFWDYLKDVSNPFNILTSRDENSRGHEYKGGEFTVVLFEGDNYTYYTSVDITITKDVTGVVRVEPTCEKDGSITTYYSDGSTDVEVLDKLNHNWSAWTFSEDLLKHTRSCSNDASHVETVECDFEKTIINEPNGNQNGLAKYTCKVCQGSYEEEFSYGEVVSTTVVKEPTCDEGGLVIVEYDNGSKVEQHTPKLGHSYGAWAYNEQTKTHTRVCTNDNTHKETKNCDFAYVVNGSEVTFTCKDCGGSYKTGLLSTEKTTYTSSEKIIVTAFCVTDGSWVGLYKKGDKYDPNNGGIVSIYWYYVVGDGENNYGVPTNILDQRKNPERTGIDESGTYSLVLFGDGGYTNVLQKIDIEIVEADTSGAVYDVYLNDQKYPSGSTISYLEGTMITLKVDGQGEYGNSWVGIYNKKVGIDTDFSNVTSTWWDWLYNVDEEFINVGSKVSLFKGDYSICVFGDSGYDDIRYCLNFSISQEASSSVIIKQPTCEDYGVKHEIYKDGTEAYVPIEPLKHAPGTWTYAADTKTHSAECANCHNTLVEDCVFDAGEIVKEATLTSSGEKLFTCTICKGTYIEVIPALGEEVKESEATRVFGETRYETSLKTADQLKATLGVDKFETVIVTDGNGFADALAGSYLAAQKNAPIIIVNKAHMDSVKAYINANLKEGGTVYILGGVNAVSKDMENGLDKFVVKRLAGATRYETNIAILKEAKVTVGDIMICTGTNFADALSVSATNKAILLVNKTLTKEQKEFLNTLKGSTFYIIGGKNAIGLDLEEQIRSNYGRTCRLAGETRYETSIIVASRFFDNPESAVLAYGLRFPDGLCGGVLAYAMNGPLILAETNKITDVKEYVAENNIANFVVLGGSGLISDEAVKDIFSMSETDEIVVK